MTMARWPTSLRWLTALFLVQSATTTAGFDGDGGNTDGDALDGSLQQKLALWLRADQGIELCKGERVAGRG